MPSSLLGTDSLALSLGELLNLLKCRLINDILKIL